jgi:hypothetical protein
MPQPAQRRVAIYARVSTQDQDPQMQLRELRSYAKHRAFVIAHEFIDHVSGATSERPELSKLWQAARARKIDTVLVWKFDRFARSTKQLIDVLEEFRHLGVDFISITEQIDTNSPMGKAMFTGIGKIKPLFTPSHPPASAHPRPPCARGCPRLGAAHPPHAARLAPALPGRARRRPHPRRASPGGSRQATARGLPPLTSAQGRPPGAASAGRQTAAAGPARLG